MPQSVVGPLLDGEQASVVEASHVQRTLVKAGPGAGKTHVIAHRIADLVLRQGLAPNVHLLMLSYTRTAVREMRDRLNLIADACRSPRLRSVTLRTMDSFAYQLHDLARKPLPDGGFDACIASATRLITLNRDVKSYLADFRHVIVDEAQDLMTVRDYFVRAILEACPGGFTVMADPNQAIYDYLAEDEAFHARSGWGELEAWMRRQWPTLKTVALNKSYRHAPAMAKAVTAGRLLLEKEPSSATWDAIAALAAGGEPEMGRDTFPLVAEDLAAAGTLAVLSRNNGQALALSRRLHQHGIEHELAYRADSRGLPSWVARLLWGLGEQFTAEDCAEAWDERIGQPSEGVPDGMQAFAALAEAVGAMEGARLDKARLLAALGDGRRLPANVEKGATVPGVLVSTVHRAKGREFDNVILHLGNTPKKDADTALESRILYVGLSRPRNDIRCARFRLHASKATSRHMTGGERWWIPTYNTAAPVEVQLGPTDFDPYSVIRDKGGITQDDLWDLCSGHTGFAKATWKDKECWLRVPDDTKAGTPVAQLTPSAISELRAICKLTLASTFTVLDDIWVDGLNTHVLAGAAPRLDGLDRKALAQRCWLVPNVRGMAIMWRWRPKQ